MRRRVLIAAFLLLVQASHSVRGQDTALRDLQAGGASIEDECAALEKQIENAWMSLETLVQDWGRQKQPDLTSESLASDLKALREQVAAKGSAVASDIGTRTLRIQTRIDAVESKLDDFPAETRKRLTEKLANAETRLRGAGKNLDKLGSVCSETEAELIQWRAEFAVNIEIDSADKARDVLRERANSRLQKIEEIRRPPAPVQSLPEQPQGRNSAQRGDPFKLLPGAWRFDEEVSPSHGGYSIQWDCALYCTGAAQWTAVGRKSRVDGNLPTPGEKQAIAIFQLRGSVNGELLGTGLESGGRGVAIVSTLAGTVERDGASLSMNVGEDGLLMSQVVGRMTRTDTVAVSGMPHLRGGRWIVREIVLPSQGGWDITWEYQGVTRDNRWTGKGRKVRVNGKDPTQGEKAAVSILSLDSVLGAGISLRGEASEENFRGQVISVSLNGDATSKGTSFLLEASENGKLTSFLVGDLSEP